MQQHAADDDLLQVGTVKEADDRREDADAEEVGSPELIGDVEEVCEYTDCEILSQNRLC